MVYLQILFYFCVSPFHVIHLLCTNSLHKQRFLLFHHACRVMVLMLEVLLAVLDAYICSVAKEVRMDSLFLIPPSLSLILPRLPT